MINRKKKLRFIQLFLLIFSLLIIYLTYYNRSNDDKDEIISKSIKEKVTKQSQDKLSDTKNDVFFNIEYTGLDLNGNRYILKSKEAYLDESKPEIVYMKVVNAIFYFKDNTVLEIWSNKGIYNNKTFDMNFEDEVRAEYLESKLYAGKANYSNSENYLSIFENVKICVNPYAQSMKYNKSTIFLSSRDIRSQQSCTEPQKN